MLPLSVFRQLKRTKNQLKRIMFIKSKIVRGALHMYQHQWHDKELHLDPTPIKLTRHLHNLTRWRPLSDYERGYLDAELDISNPQHRYIRRA